MCVGGTWKYLFRTVNKTGGLIDFMPSDRRNTRGAPLPKQGLKDHTKLTAGLDRHCQARLVSNDKPALTTRRSPVRQRDALNVKIPEQRH